jgi:hypothetical protein
MRRDFDLKKLPVIKGLESILPPRKEMHVVIVALTQGYFVWKNGRSSLDALTYKPWGLESSPTSM